jgi:prepilin-type N-terminal cleavage/methylation domain-containing protein
MNTKGFTLIELAIVLVIVTILIGGLAVPLSAQIQARRIAETRHDMEAIHDALIGYAMSHTFPHPTIAGEIRHYLPCPDNNNDGLEDARNAAGQCTNKRAKLPWITLGVKGADAWGNRYIYAVDRRYSKNQNVDGIDDDGIFYFPEPDVPELAIFPDAFCTAPTVMDDVPAVVVSHGPNGWGARNVNGNTLAAPTSADERQNLDVVTSSLPCNDTTKFVSRNPTDDFDDLVIWLSSNRLFNRVCPAGGCP